jgi:hypothetical protein
MLNIVDGAIMSGDITANPEGEQTIDGIPMSKCIGVMVGYTIQSCLVPVMEFKDYAEKIGLPEEFVPDEPKNIDAFKRALKSIERHEIIYENNQSFRREVSVKAGHKNNWHTISESIFGRSENGGKYDTNVRQRVIFKVKLENESNIIIEPYDETVIEPNMMEDFSKQIEEKFILYLTHYHGDYIRRALRKFVKESSGIPYTVANGGVFFVPVEAYDNALIWEKMIDWIRNDDYKLASKRYTGTGSRFIMKAVLDTQKERLFIKEDVEKELANVYRQWLKDILHQLKGKKNEETIEVLLYHKIAEKGELTNEVANKYSELLGQKIRLQIHEDVIKDVRDFSYRDETGTLKQPSGRLQGMFEELIRVGE